MMTNRGLVAAVGIIVVASLPAAAFGTAAAKHKPKPPATGKYVIKSSPNISTGSFTVAKKGKHESVTKFGGTWSPDAGATCGVGAFTVTPAEPITLSKYTSSTKVWTVGKLSRNNGDPGVKVKVKFADGTSHNAHLSVIFGQGKKKGSTVLLKPSGELRLSQGSCEAPFGFKHS